MKNLGQMMKQAQEMQAKMQELQLALEAMEVEGQAGGGLVKVVLNGKGELKSIDIDPSIFVASEKEVVEDLIKAAHHEAKTGVEKKTKDEMGRLTGGIDLPPDMKLPF